MPKPTKGPRLGGSPTHQRLILRNLAAQLFEHGRITTTETKAKRLRPFAEKLITKAKRGDLHNLRLVISQIGNKDAAHVLFHEIAPSLEGRDGGYTRITKVGPRQGDNAPMAVIEIMTESVEESRKTKEKLGRKVTSAKDTKTTVAKPIAEDKEQESNPSADLPTESETTDQEPAPSAESPAESEDSK